MENTLANLHRYVYWPTMQEQVAKYIWYCALCCTRKPNDHKLDLYELLLIPNKLLERMFMDFMVGFPLSKKGHNYLFFCGG